MGQRIVLQLRNLLRKLGCEDISLFDRGWLRQKLGSLLHQCGSNRARKVCLPSRFIRKRVVDGEGGRSQPECEPYRCGRILLDDCQTSPQKSFDVSFLSGLCLEPNEQCYVNHVSFPFLMTL